MARYIDAEQAKTFFEEIDAGSRANTTLLTPYEFAEYLDEIPTADVQEVRHGHWILLRESEITGFNPEFAGRDPIGGYQCSNCKEVAIFDCNDEFVLSRYCPHCGAKMDGEREEGNDNG